MAQRVTANPTYADPTHPPTAIQMTEYTIAEYILHNITIKLPSVPDITKYNNFQVKLINRYVEILLTIHKNEKGETVIDLLKMEDAPNAHIEDGYKRQCLFNILKYLKENNYIKDDFDVFDSSPERHDYITKEYLEKNMNGNVEHEYLQNFKIILDKTKPFEFGYRNPIKVYFKNFFCDIELDIITTETPSNNSVTLQKYFLKDPPKNLQAWEPTIGSRCSLYHLLKYLLDCNNITDVFPFKINDANVSGFGQGLEIESIRNKEIKEVIDNLAINEYGEQCYNPNTLIERLEKAKAASVASVAKGGMKIIKSSRKKKKSSRKKKKSSKKKKLSKTYKKRMSKNKNI